MHSFCRTLNDNIDITTFMIVIMSNKAKRDKNLDVLVSSEMTIGGDGPPEPENLDKVRAILFGAQVRETDRRFAKLEEQVNRDLYALREDLRRRLDDLEAFVRDENDAFSKRLVAEQKSREEADEELSTDLKQAVKAAKAARGKLEQGVEEKDRALRARILEQSNDLSDAMQKQFDAMSSMLKDAVDTLQEEKTDRLRLADMFEEISTRLRSDFRLTLDE